MGRRNYGNRAGRAKRRLYFPQQSKGGLLMINETFQDQRQKGQMIKFIYSLRSIHRTSSQECSIIIRILDFYFLLIFFKIYTKTYSVYDMTIFAWCYELQIFACKLVCMKCVTDKSLWIYI
jgi:hypothetical protein